MKFKPQTVFSLLVVIFFAVFLYETRGWRLQARLFPWAIGIPMLILALVHIFLELKGLDKNDGSDSPPMQYQPTYTVDDAVIQRRTVNIFAWLFGFLGLIWLLGFDVSIPVLCFLYLKVRSKEGWLLSLVLTASAWLIFWGLFVRLLHLPFPDGQLLVWLGLQ
jgi:hypothetical protein